MLRRLATMRRSARYAADHASLLIALRWRTTSGPAMLRRLATMRRSARYAADRASLLIARAVDSAAPAASGSILAGAP
jgi:hypothetical protein